MQLDSTWGGAQWSAELQKVKQFKFGSLKCCNEKGPFWKMLSIWNSITIISICEIIVYFLSEICSLLIDNNKNVILSDRSVSPFNTSADQWGGASACHHDGPSVDILNNFQSRETTLAWNKPLLSDNKWLCSVQIPSQGIEPVLTIIAFDES